MLCDGEALRVTANLDQALKRIRQRLDGGGFHIWYCGRLPVWVDALSINQTDTAERNHSVRHMDDVYRKCLQLVIWLGEHSDGEEGVNERHLLSKAEWTGQDDDESWSTDDNYCPYSPGEESTLALLLATPWFTRRWTIQEYALAYRRHMLLGDQLLDSSSLVCAADACDMRSLSGPLITHVDHLYGMLELLQKCQSAECSVAHDRVYALMHISRGGANLEVDYEQPVEDLYFQVAQNHLASYARFTWTLFPLLAYATARAYIHPVAASLHQLPSWVPDWRQAARYSSKEHRTAVDYLTDRPSWAESIPGVQRPHCKIQTDRALLLKGYVIQPCLPPVHEFDGDCISCTLFGRTTWSGWSDELRIYLGQAVEGDKMLFLPGVSGYRVFVVLLDLLPSRGVANLTQNARLHSCFLGPEGLPPCRGELLRDLKSRPVSTICIV